MEKCYSILINSFSSEYQFPLVDEKWKSVRSRRRFINIRLKLHNYQILTEDS